MTWTFSDAQLADLLHDDGAAPEALLPASVTVAIAQRREAAVRDAQPQIAVRPMVTTAGMHPQLRSHLKSTSGSQQ